MLQAKFTIENQQAGFLEKYRIFGFKNKSEMVRAALEHFQKSFEQNQIIASAELYSEVYEEDNELKDMTENAVTGWPE
jgi:hypothetical protein